MKHFITIPGLCLMLVACRDDWKTIEAYVLPAKDACSEKMLRLAVETKTPDTGRKRISENPLPNRIPGSQNAPKKENAMKKVEQFAQDIVSPRFRAEADKAPDTKQEACVDINNADAEALKTLRGVGDAKAMQIIKFRSKRPFRHKKDIMKIKGIGRKSYIKLADRICDIRPPARKNDIRRD